MSDCFHVGGSLRLRFLKFLLRIIVTETTAGSVVPLGRAGRTGFYFKCFI